MSLYTRELLIDLAGQKPDVVNEHMLVMHCDLIGSIQMLYNTGQVDKRAILCLDRYVAGESLTELSIDYPDAAELLWRVLSLIEYTSLYTDESFLRYVVTAFPKYHQHIDGYRSMLHKVSREF